MGKHSQGIDNKVISRIYGNGRGWVFITANFSDLEGRNAVTSVLKGYLHLSLFRHSPGLIYLSLKDQIPFNVPLASFSASKKGSLLNLFGDLPR
jgi:hypothetical protein